MTPPPAHVVMARVVLAVLLRETRTRFGRYQFGYLWAFLEPLTHVAVFIAVFTALGRTSPIGDSLALFLITGVVPWLVFTHTVNRVAKAVDGNRALLMFPQVTRIDLMLARIILEAATASVVFVVLCLLVRLFETRFTIERPLDVIAVFACLIVLGAGTGIATGVISSVFPTFERLFAAIRRPLYFASGVFFIADNLPPEARAWIAYNPLAHLIEWLRSAFFVGFESSFVDHRYAVACSLVAVVFGLAAERAIRPAEKFA
ncbi:Transport permease protein [uncultured Defluviicoccus sp.]|uniref:Transport permease protein n=1 Tax=metagenome TaxID=256318 RepID=A0A380TAD9_9ZZZZ|nr:Transport permease protein [uncultured Defluviicoccus sp.]